MHSSCIALWNVSELVCSCHTYHENAENSKPEVRQKKSFYCCNFMSALLYWFMNFHLPPWSSVICLMLFANLYGLTTVILDLWCRRQKTDSLTQGQCKSTRTACVCEALLSVGAPVLMSLIWMHSLPLYTTLESSYTAHENLLCNIYGVSFICLVTT